MPFDTFLPSSSWIHHPVCFLTGGRRAHFKLFWPYFGCRGNGTAPTGERVRALQEKFAVDCAVTLADRACGRDLEDGTLQNLLNRDADSLSHLSLPEEVRKASTLCYYNNVLCVSPSFVPFYMHIITFFFASTVYF